LEIYRLVTTKSKIIVDGKQKQKDSAASVSLLEDSYQERISSLAAVDDVRSNRHAKEREFVAMTYGDI
jgi:hypothetical protein